MARNRLEQKPCAAPLWQATMASLLCAGLLFPADLAAEQPGTAARASQHPAPLPRLTQEQRSLHALNRLTFGPRPDDVATANRMGLEAWFSRQLHPERIDDAALDVRLANFPAMQLSQAELVARFPTPEMLRRYSHGGLLAPGGEMERAIYDDASFSYEEKREAKQAAQAATAASSTASTPAPIVRRTTSGDVAVAAPATTIMSPNSSGPSPMSPGQKDAVLALPAGPRLAKLVAMSPEEMASLQGALKGPDKERIYTGMGPAQIEQVAAMSSPERVVGAEALSVRLLRDVYSKRQLQAVMADFWLNHFSVFLRKNQSEPYLLPAYEREAILPNALGRFEDLLVATAESPAMLVYLDNWESIGPNSKAAQRSASGKNRPNSPLVKMAAKVPQGINENYARELMELHTLGVKGGYTQQDVIEVAKCFSGWTIDRPAQGGEFLFNPNRHEPGSKTVLGHLIKEDGINEGFQVLHILATSPATAHFVSLKLAERFVSDTPAPALVDRMAATFLKSGGDLKAVLTTMFHSPEFWSPDVYRAKVKTPLEFVVSALRATDADVVNPVPLVQALDRLGMPIYGMQTPNGYSWQADAWVSSNALLTRMNFALVLSGNRVGGTKLDWAALLGPGTDPSAQPSAAAEQRLEAVLLGQPAAPQTRIAAIAGANTPGVQQVAERSFRATPASSAKQQAGAEVAGSFLQVKAPRAPLPAPAPETPLATMAGLLVGSPDFQRR